MFTEVETLYLKELVATYCLKGEYTYYVAYTYTDISGSYNVDVPDVVVYFSKEEIVNNGQKFAINNGVKISIDSGTASRNGQNSNRYEIADFSGTVTVPIYEFIYSNAKNFRFSDLLAKEEYVRENNLSFNLDKNDFYILPIFFGLLIMMLFLKWCFPMKGGKRI